MRPAFSSLSHKAAFALLLCATLAGPLLAGKKILPPRDELYSAVPWGQGAYPWLHDQIFVEKGDVDIAFMGCSPIWWGIDTPEVEKELSQKLGRPAVVRSLCWNWPGIDPLYFIAKDLLAHRRVHMIVFCDLTLGCSPGAQLEAQNWFRYADNAADLSGLSPRAKASFYAASILGLPRNLISLLRTNGPVLDTNEVSWGDFQHMENPARHLGAMPLRIAQSGAFADYAPASRVDPAEVCVYSKSTAPKFTFGTEPLWPMQAAFARKVAALARENGVQLVYLHMPKLSEKGSATIPEPRYWPEFFGPGLAMVAIPFDRFTAGLDQDQIGRLYWDFQHFNLNGQKYFTPAITPALLQIYEHPTAH